MAMILAVILVMVSVPVAVALFVNDQEPVVGALAVSNQAMQAAQAGLAEFESHLSGERQLRQPVHRGAERWDHLLHGGLAAMFVGDRGHGGLHDAAHRLLQRGLRREHAHGERRDVPALHSGPDPNDPAFSNRFDPNCGVSSSTSSASGGSSYAWTVVSGSTSQADSEYQYVVDARGVTAPNINVDDAVAYVYVTGRSGGRRATPACRSRRPSMCCSGRRAPRRAPRGGPTRSCPRRRRRPPRP